MAFLVLLFGVSATGLALYSATGSALVSVLLPLHLGLVFVFFILTPYSKMAHGFYRMASLIQEAALGRAREQ
jgi:citrate/tricarballylate utilization protein